MTFLLYVYQEVFNILFGNLEKVPKTPKGGVEGVIFRELCINFIIFSQDLIFFLSSGGTSTVDLGCVSIYLFVCLFVLSFRSKFIIHQTSTSANLLSILFVHVMVRYPCSYFCRFCEEDDWISICHPNKQQTA